MQKVRARRAAGALVVLALLVAGALVAGFARGDGGDTRALGWKPTEFLNEGAGNKELQGYWQGAETGGSGGEAFEALTAATQWAQARTAPSGVVGPGAYTSAYTQLTELPAVGGAWNNVSK